MRLVSALSLLYSGSRREKEGSNGERLRDWLCLRRPCPLVSQIASTVYITFGLALTLKACKHSGCLTETPEPLFWRNIQLFYSPFFSTSTGHLLLTQSFFFCPGENERLLLSVIKAVHASIPLLGFCVDQTEPSLWSRQDRDKEVSGRTLASLGISFTGVKEAHTL